MTSCTLCDLPATDSAIQNDDGEPFCCRGCLNVHTALGAVEVDEHVASAPAPVLKDENSASVPDDADTAYISVGGMHCASCEYFLEHLGRGQSGVYDADASYATEMVRVQYDPAETDEDTILGSLSTLNYTAGTTELDSAPSNGPDLESRLLVGGIFGMMAMVWYGLFLYPTYFGYEPVVSFGQFDGAYLGAQLAVVTAIILGYTGQPMLRGAYVSVRTRQPNVDLLVSIAALAAFGYSILRIFQGGMDLYFDVTIVVVMAVTIGNYYQERVKRSATGLLTELTTLQTDEARLASGERISLSDVEPGDELLVRPGERIPLDGRITEGTADIDESLVTGEPVPVRREPGESVIGGAIVTDAPIRMRVGTDASSTVDHLVTLLWDIQSSRSGVQRVADKLSTIFVPLVLVLAAGIGVWMLLTGAAVRTAILTSLTVLIVACPCALGLATPLAVASGLQSAAREGIVVTTPELFETGDDVDVIALDKTGTLTTGTMAVQGISAPDGDSERLLERTAALERYVQHPVAEAIGQAVEQDTNPRSNETRAAIDSIVELDRGVRGTVNGDDVLVGHPSLFENAEWTVPNSLITRTESIWNRGGVPVVVGWNGSIRGVIEVGDELRPGWEAAVTELGADRKLVLLSGDESKAVEQVGDHPAIDDVFAGVPPEGKVATVRRLAADGTVAMVGDGSNDAPALAAADVGIAMGSGTQIASDAADAVILDGNIEKLPAVFDTAGQTRGRIHQNLAWAFVYNGIAIPLALTGLLNPLFAAIAMGTSSLLVVVNSMRGQERDSDGSTSDEWTPSGLEREVVAGD